MTHHTRPTGDEEIHVWVEGRIGRLELNRPRAMNALTWPMTRRAEEALDAWRDEDAIDAILITGAGERGLCAGADIRQMAAMTGEEGYAFLDHEYGLNLVINEYPKPYISVMDGVTMGGGMGMSAHGRHRIVTERSRLAMPECRIGLIPDVGMSYLLARSPGELGTYLSLTASEANGADAIALGLADVFVPSAALPAVIAELCGLDRATSEEIDGVLARHRADPGPSPLAEKRAWIDAAFSSDDVREIDARLRAQGTSEALAAADTLRAHMCPTSTVTALEAIRRAARMTQAQVLRQDLQAVSTMQQRPDFREGVRAQVIDKDRNPHWSPATWDEVDPAEVASILEVPA